MPKQVRHDCWSLSVFPLRKRLLCRQPVRDCRGGEAVAIAMEPKGGTPESPTCRMAGNRQKATSTPRTTAGGSTRTVTARKPPQGLTAAPMTGTSATCWWALRTQIIQPPTSMGRTAREATNTRRTRKRCTSTKCGRTARTAG